MSTSIWRVGARCQPVCRSFSSRKENSKPLRDAVTGLTLQDFEQLVNAKVFNDSKMNDAVWKFRTFEEPSLHYGAWSDEAETLGGWNVSRDQRL